MSGYVGYADLSVCLSVCLPACLPACLSVCLSVWLAGWLAVCPFSPRILQVQKIGLVAREAEQQKLSDAAAIVLGP